MKPFVLTDTRRRWLAIALFYAIAVGVRALALQLPNHATCDMHFFLVCWAEGIGPCLGALVAVWVLRREFCCTLTGTSLLKSLLSVAVPFVVCFCLYRELSYVLLGFIVYSLLEEVGWRGYLQGELKHLNPFWQAVLVGLMWWLWHLQLSFTPNALVFLGILILGAWGIGRIATDTHSLMACACFHTLYNFSTHGFFEFTPLVICLYVGVVLSWFVIWYTPWQKLLSNLRNRAHE